MICPDSAILTQKSFYLQDKLKFPPPDIEGSPLLPVCPALDLRTHPNKPTTYDRLTHVALSSRTSTFLCLKLSSFLPPPHLHWEPHLVFLCKSPVRVWHNGPEEVREPVR